MSTIFLFFIGIPLAACVISFWGRLLRAAFKHQKLITQKASQIHDRLSHLSSVAEPREAQ